MPDLELYIGNKNYSSWSFRPWIALKQADISFQEHLVPFDFDNGNPKFRSFSPSMKVPVLTDRGFTVWDSLAILEYVAEVFPDRSLWPQEVRARAHARAISSEMHSGFPDLRAECPMNFRRPVEDRSVSEGVRKDVMRIEAIWDEALTLSGGPFLFGAFSIADAMYAPVVSRFRTYGLSGSEVFCRYRDAMIATSAWQSWEEDALQETWVVEVDEV